MSGAAHTQGIYLPVQFGKQALRFLHVAVGADALNADLYILEIDDDLLVAGRTSEADADGSLHRATPSSETRLLLTFLGSGF